MKQEPLRAGAEGSDVSQSDFKDPMRLRGVRDPEELLQVLSR